MSASVATQAASVPLLEVKRDSSTGRIWSHVRSCWLVETPEETVRQQYLCLIVNEYGFGIDQIAEELTVTGSGSGKARADFLIWRTPEDKKADKKPLIVVECKAENVEIDAKAYTQGANYAQYTHAQFFVTHNNQETKYWKVDHAKMMPNFDEVGGIPHANASDQEIDELISKLRVFKENDFAELLRKCHNIIRNSEAYDAAKSFDETAKILFIKVWVERELRAKRKRKNIFNVEYLDDQIGSDPINTLFEQTKDFYESDGLFEPSDRVDLKPETSREIIKLLEGYNLSESSEDIKGIAFERFLGRTFRDELGQFFTPRPIVEFMVRMIDPQIGEKICDPASGSGGFLIRYFRWVRQKIMLETDRAYREFEEELRKDESLSEEERARRLSAKYAELEEQLDQRILGTTMWSLSNLLIHGLDKNARMARTSKMNMIMHGDGHGGVHHGDGFLDTHGIFAGQFDIVLTNPPFGAKVSAKDKVLQADTALPKAVEKQNEERFGAAYVESRARLKAAIGKPILSLYTLGTSIKSAIKTEVLFVERCLNLLKPGGRLGIVLPESILNNPSLERVRKLVEGQAKLMAVVSLPVDTFISTGAHVKTSVIFVRKFTDDEKMQFDCIKLRASKKIERLYSGQVAELEDIKNRKRVTPKQLIASGVPPEGAVKKANAANDALRQQKKEAAAKLKSLRGLMVKRADELLRRATHYPVFLYEAEKVGITATGAADENELFPNSRVPANREKLRSSSIASSSVIHSHSSMR